MVLQKNHIFNGTIEENILCGKPDATKAEIIEATKKAYLHDQVMLMPKQYESNALELSGGQQQRIAIFSIEKMCKGLRVSRSSYYYC